MSGPLQQISAGTAQTPAQTPQESGGWLGSLTKSLSSFGQNYLWGIAPEEFQHWFVDRYGQPSPVFMKDSWGDSVQQALAMQRLLLVWFHQAEDDATSHLCRNVLQSPVVLEAIERSFVLWGGDVNRFEPSQIARLIGVTTFPSLVVVLPVRDAFNVNQFSVEWPLGIFCRPLQRISPAQSGEALDADTVVLALATASQDYSEELQNHQELATRRNLQLAEERLLREQQDREFEESLLADQLRQVEEQERKTAAARSSEEVQKAAEAEASAQALAAKAAEEAKDEDQRKRRASEILAEAEPVASEGVETVKLSLRLPSGDRLQRTFRATQTLEEVYEWAHCCRPEAKPKYFELCMSFPTRTLRDKSANLKDLDLIPSAALVLKETES